MRSVSGPARFDGDLNGEFGEYWQRTAQETLEEFRRDFENGEIVVDADGVLRWRNGNIIGYDVAHICDLIGIQFDAEATRRAGEERTRAFMEEYRRARANRTLSAEERSEMRSAFGEGAVVVDVITGQRFVV